MLAGGWGEGGKKKEQRSNEDSRKGKAGEGEEENGGVKIKMGKQGRKVTSGRDKVQREKGDVRNSVR